MGEKVMVLTKLSGEDFIEVKSDNTYPLETVLKPYVCGMCSKDLPLDWNLDDLLDTSCGAEWMLTEEELDE